MIPSTPRIFADGNGEIKKPMPEFDPAWIRVHDAEPRPSVLITEADVRAILEAPVVEALLDAMRHYLTQDGTRYWVREDCEDLLGAIDAGKGVRR